MFIKGKIKRLGINTDSFASGKQCLTLSNLFRAGAIPGISEFFVSIQCPAGLGGRSGKWLCSTRKLERGINAFYTSYYVSQYYSDLKRPVIARVHMYVLTAG